MSSAPATAAPSGDTSAFWKDVSQVLVGCVILVVAAVCFTILYRHYKDRRRSSLGTPSAGAGQQLANGEAGYAPGAGLDEATIKASGPLHPFTAAGRQDLEGAVRECAVCLVEYREGDICRTLDKCGHFFHQTCIDVWLQSKASCPLCRVSLQPDTKLVEAPAAETSESGSGVGTPSPAPPSPMPRLEVISLPAP